jgi:glycosyltransferase involved in cell wall biosynthesis
MTRCVVISEIPVAYRAGWFEWVRANSSLELDVVYLAGGQPDRPWERAAGEAEWITYQRTFTLGGTARGYFPRLAVRLGRTLGSLRPDVVVLPGWAHPVCLQAMLWCRRHRVPYGVAFESWKTQAQTSAPRRVTGRIRRAVLDRAAVAMPVGRRAAEFARSLGIEPVVVVHGNSCDAAGIARATAGTGRHPNPTVLFVGRLMPHKGADLLVDVARRLVADGVDVRIVGDGPERGAVEALASSSKRVTFLGPKPAEEVHSEMAAAWLVLVPSREEPWGVVVHEALAAGTPVVATTEVGSTTDLIDDAAVGRVVAPDAAALYEACTSLLASGVDTTDRCRAAALRVSYETATRELTDAVATATGRAAG